MSRIGKKPVAIPSGIKVAIEGIQVNVEGPKGKLSMNLPSGISAAMDGASVVLKMADESSKPNYGTSRALLANMVKGVSQGYTEVLEMNGVGYGATVTGNKLSVKVGFSHPVEMELPEGVKCAVNKTIITLTGANRQDVGGFAAKVRGIAPAEPYLGKGIKYEGERIRRKAGKAAAGSKGAK
jgi:large subunit ribosomal protein L6